MTENGTDEPSAFLQKCRESHNLVQAFLSDSLPTEHLAALKPQYVERPQRRQIVKKKVEKTLEVLDGALENHILDEIALSYNGGKDCLVMLTLLLATIYKKVQANPAQTLSKDYKLDSIYVRSEETFPEVNEFVAQSNKEYHLNSITIDASMKEGFAHYLEKVNAKVKAIVVGIRYADPYGSQLQYEQATDHNWPEFLRIHPILHWHYCDIWDFIMACNLHYCILYDQGYTSLGGVNSTVRNDFLKVEGKHDTYLPAYMLEEYADERERIGRTKK